MLEVPDADLLAEAGGNRDIGLWAVATLATDAGGWRSINRVGLPMIHPLFTQYNEDLGDRLNAGRPADDFATYGPTIIKAVAGAGEGQRHRRGSGRLCDGRRASIPAQHAAVTRVGTRAVFGVAGWNGRSLTDNAPDVMFTIAANTPISLGIGKASVTPPPSATFPYVPKV